MQIEEKLDWTRLASALRAIAIEKMNESSNLITRCNADAAAQERMIGELLRCVAVAIEVARSDAAMTPAARP